MSVTKWKVRESMDETQIYNQALEDITKRMITYYGNIDTTSGASVQYYVSQIKKELTRGDNNENQTR
jgi:hypothetical protein